MGEFAFGKPSHMEPFERVVERLVLDALVITNLSLKRSSLEREKESVDPKVVFRILFHFRL